MTNKINYIEKVEISGLWQRYDITWNLNPDVNILAGINGSGKTTILDCVCGLIAVGKIPESRLGMVSKLKLFFDNGRCLPYERIRIKDTIKNLERKARNGETLYKEVVSEIREREGNNYKNVKAVEFERHSISFEDLKMTRDELQKATNVDVISTFDNSLKSVEAVRKLSDDAVETELDWDVYQLQKLYLDYQLNIGKRKDTVFENNKSNPFYDAIVEDIDKIKYPQRRFLEIIDDLFSETGKRINKEKNEVEFLLGNKEITPFQLSSGEKQLLIILLTVLIQDNKPSILFMDEPEISLHIEWQKKIIKYIRELNPNAQVIIATHSPAIIMEGWMDKVFEVRDLIVKDYEKL